ncbi:MAG: hypothetical protein Q7U16_10415 [Agitococcus sp.]|nr:hypothetical protein [Agitococcus sp.]
MISTSNENQIEPASMSGCDTSKRVVGGSAAERGLDFQARVSAIVMAHLLAERPLGWLTGMLMDRPYQIDAETGGVGDDIGFICDSGQIVEVQVKRGLRVGIDLWDALMALADGVSTKQITAGVLAVCPNSSGTVRSVLADDIVRMGTGRFDGLRDSGNEFLKRLIAKSIDVDNVCRAIRIITIAAVDGNRESENTACERLSSVAQNPALAWTSLVAYARRLIQIRGRATGESLSRELALCNVLLKTTSTETSVQLRASLRQWLEATHSQLSILGVSRPVALKDCWIPLKATVVDSEQAEPEELDKALSRYHAYASHRRHTERSVDAHTLGRYVKRGVILGGPGIGKSTLLKKLALEYAKDGYLVLLARLPLVAALMKRDGRRFEDSLMEAALSSSGLRSKPIALDDAVILCDGLDECGNLQLMVIEAVHAFTAAHPTSRVLIASRPIGYQSGLLGNWRHYELQPLEDNVAERAIATVLKAIPFPNAEKREIALELAKEQLKARHIKGLAARSPLMLTLIAALVAKGVEPGSSRTALYRQLFRLIEDHPPTRMCQSPPSEPERNRFLELLGWALLRYGSELFDQTQARCALWWGEETGKRSLECQSIVQECLSYWETLGVIERVRTSTEEAVTFVHKTFGEFAAAQYISKCAQAEQRELLAQAIRTKEWRETLSFASHLGLAGLVLEVWSELAQAENSAAAFVLDEAMELVVQSGIPIAYEVLDIFVRCCWAVAANSSSRACYAGGDALCRIAQTNWPVVRKEALDNLEATDNWLRLVAWACMCVSPEESIPYPEMLQLLRNFEDHWPKRSYFGKLNLSSGGHTVQESLVLGAAKRILRRSAEDVGLDVLDKFLIDPDSLSMKIYVELVSLNKEAGRSLPQGKYSSLMNLEMNFAGRGGWRNNAASLMEIIDDPRVDVDDRNIVTEEMYELGALLNATGFWEIPVSNMAYFLGNTEEYLRRREVLHLVAQTADIDIRNLVVQARFCHKRASVVEENLHKGLFGAPHVDVVPDFGVLDVGREKLPMLLEVILCDGQYFGSNAAKVLHVFRDDIAYLPALERIFERGEGIALHYAAALAQSLPTEECQKLLLHRLISSPLTRGCCYLFSYLRSPFGARHEDAVFRGLASDDATVAVAAAKIATQLNISPSLVKRLRNYFEEWQTKEEPYPTKEGTVPDSPRDELAKLLAREISTDTALLIAMAEDTRPEVRKAAIEPLTAALAASWELHDQVLSRIATGRLDSMLLNWAISAGTFADSNALKVVPLLRNCSSRVRFNALPILNPRYLPVGLIRSEAERLMSDPEIDVREGAHKALMAL